MAEKSLEMVVKARDETRAALKSSRENAKRTERQFEKLDNQVKKMRKQRAGTRIKQDEQLNNQQMRMLQRRIDLGDEAARTEKRRIEINQQFQKERRQLLKIIRSEQSSQQQRMRAQRQLRELEQDRTRQLRQLNQVQRKTGQAAAGALTKVRGLVGAFGAFAAGAAIGQGLRETLRVMQELTRQTTRFQEELTPLLSLGENLESINEIQQQVRGMSTAFGESRDTIAKALFDVQSSAANLSDTVQNQLVQSALRATQVYGGDLPSNLRLGIKTFQIYGDQVASVAEQQGKLALTAERGALNMQQMANLGPELFAAANAAGVGLDKLLGSIVVATQRGGKTEKVFTGLRNVFLRMARAEEKGIELTGSLFDKLKQLQELSRVEKIKLFGAEAIAPANNLIQAVEQLRKETQRLSEDLPDIGQKLDQSLKDPQRRLAAMQQSIEQLSNNKFLGLEPNQGPRTAQNLDVARAVAERRLAQNPGQALLLNAVTFGNAAETAAGINRSTGAGNLARSGLEQIARNQIKEGALERAEVTIERLEMIGSDKLAGKLGDKLNQAQTGQRIRDLFQRGKNIRQQRQQADTAEERAKLLEKELKAQRKLRQAVQKARERGRSLPGELVDLLTEERFNRSRNQLNDLLQKRRFQATRGEKRFGPDGTTLTFAPPGPGERPDGGSDQQVRFTGPTRQLTSENDQRVDFRTDRQRQQARDAAEQTLKEQQRAILQQRARLGDEQAKQKLERQRIKEDIQQQRQALKDIVQDQALSAERRERARAQLSRLDKLEQRRLAAVGADETDKAGDGPGRAPQAFSQTQAARLIFDAQKKADSPQQKTADNTKQMLEKLDQLIEAVGEQTGLSDLLEVFQA